MILTILIFMLGVSQSQEKASGLPVLKGSYLGQKPPGMTPVLFAPDIFISFKDRTGNWTEAKNMGPRINSDMHELCPNVTADRKYLFFNRNHGEKGDLRIFWVSAKIIDDMKSEELK